MNETTIMVAEKPDVYASGVLEEKHHGRLVADLDNYARDAGIQPHWIYKPLAKTCGEGVIEWTRRFRFHKLEGHSGLAMIGGKNVDWSDCMSAIAGALVRNFIRARVITVSRLMDEIEGNEPPTNYTCLLIPNFYIGKKQGGHLPEWRASLLLDFLLERHTAGKQTVLSVSNISNLSQEYGDGFTKLIQKNYQTLDL